MVKVEQVRLLYDQASSGLVITLVVTLTLGTFLLTEEASVPTIVAWWLATVFIIAWRWLLIRQFRSAKDVDSNPTFWSQRFVVGATLAGLTWGIGGAAAAFEVSLLNQTLILVVIGVMAVTAILFLGSVVTAYVGYLLGATLPLIVWMLWQRDFIHLVIAVLTCVLIVGAWLAALKFNRFLAQTLYLESKSKALADELQESETLFKQAAQIAGLGHFVWDELVGRCIFASDEYARILGLTVDQALAQYDTHDKFIMLVHPDNRGRVLATFAKFCKQGVSYDIEYRIIRSDGEERHIRESGDPVVDYQGQLIRTVGILQDITERAETHKSLEQSEAKLKLATQTARLGYWHFDEVANEYLEISDEFALIFGYTAEEYLERFRHLEDDMELVYPEDRAAVFEAYESGIGEGIDYRVLRRDGSIAHVREISQHIEDNDGNLIEAIGTIQDITELKEAKIGAERASQAKTDFLSSISHELRTPMNAILGFGQMLDVDSSEPLSERQKSFVDHILESGKHMMELIDDLLELNQIEAGKLSINFELIAANKIIDESLRLIQTRAQQEGIEILVRIPRDELPILLTDGTRLRQVLLNLLSNAVKYNSKDGTVTLSCQETANHMLRISVADAGVGIPEDKHKDLFKSFQRLGRESGDIEGTGIGLTIAKQMIELMGGEIGYQSEEGKGSNFWVDVPISRKQAPAKKNIHSQTGVTH